MKNERGFTIYYMVIVMVLLVAIVPFGWNAVKFASCDFRSDYKCEVIHGIGVIMPPASIVTVWFASDEK